MCKHYYFTPDGSAQREESDERAQYESQVQAGNATQNDGTTRRLDTPGTTMPPDAYTQRLPSAEVPAPQPYAQAPRPAAPQQQYGRSYGRGYGAFPWWAGFWLIWPALAIMKWVLPFFFFGAFMGPHSMGPLVPLLIVLGFFFVMRAMRGGRRGWGGYPNGRRWR